MHYSTVIPALTAGAALLALTHAVPVYPRNATVTVTNSSPDTCAPGTGYYQVCSNGFKGCSTTDRCSTPAENSQTTSATQNGAYYVCANNGFRGYCSVDPCALPWCPDATKPTDESSTTINEAQPTATNADTPVPPPYGTTDGGKYNRGPNSGTEEATPTPAPYGTTDGGKHNHGPGSGTQEGVPDQTKRPPFPIILTCKNRKYAADPICPADEGTFQRCDNGFVGCCKQDACSIGYCPPECAY